MVKFNEEQNNNNTINKIDTTTTTTINSLPRKGRFIIDSENINTSLSNLNSTCESTPATASTQNTEIKKGRFSLLENISTENRGSVEVLEGGEKKGRFEVQASPTISINDTVKHGRFYEVNSAQPGGSDSQKQINERLDLMLKQSERQFYILNELMSSLNVKQKNSQDTNQNAPNILDTINTLNDQIQSLMNEVEGLQKENISIRTELENKKKMNDQLLIEIEQLRKKNEELRS